jgi:hypothetical protein
MRPGDVAKGSPEDPEAAALHHDPGPGQAVVVSEV